MESKAGLLTPGTATEPVRALELAAGAQSVSDLQAFPSIAGDEADRTLTLLDGLPIRTPYRFVGAFSIFNPLLTSALGANPHGYSADFGNAFSSLTTVASRAEYPAAFQSDVLAGFPFTMAGLAIPLDDTTHTVVRIGGRLGTMRQFAAIIPAQVKERVREFFPEIADGAVIVRSSPAAGTDVEANALFTSEHGNAFNSDLTFTYGWKKQYASAQVFHTFAGWKAHLGVVFQSDHLNIISQVPSAQVDTSETINLAGTYSSQYAIADLSTGPPNICEARIGVCGDWRLNESEFDGSFNWLNIHSPAVSREYNRSAFVQVMFAPWDAVSIDAGARLSRFGSIGAGGMEFRGAMTWRPDENALATISAGNYLMASSDSRLVDALIASAVVQGTVPRLFLPSRIGKQLLPERSDAISGSLSRTFAISSVADCAVEVEGYVKRGSNIIMPARFPYIFATHDTESFVPDQSYRTKAAGGGITGTLRFHPLGLTLSQTAYWQRSRTFDREGISTPTSADIPWCVKSQVVVTGRGWTVRLSLRQHAGSPYTDASVIRVDNGFGGGREEFVWNRVNTSRLPDYSRMDILVSKEFSFIGGTVAPYCEFINLLDEPNVSGIQHFFFKFDDIFDLRAADRVEVHNTFPFFPTLGVIMHWSL